MAENYLIFATAEFYGLQSTVFSGHSPVHFLLFQFILCYIRLPIRRYWAGIITLNIIKISVEWFYIFKRQFLQMKLMLGPYWLQQHTNSNSYDFIILKWKFIQTHVKFSAPLTSTAYLAFIFSNKPQICLILYF